MNKARRGLKEVIYGKESERWGKDRARRNTTIIRERGGHCSSNIRRVDLLIESLKLVYKKDDIRHKQEFG